jgi:trimethylamine-N-oxide reductase (cytochrome c), cytochrome c-type subunit TorC
MRRTALSGRAWIIGGTIAAGGIVVGLLFGGGLSAALDYTDRQEFCISCHEMKDTSFAEYSKTIHYQNASGVRAVCADCHVPRALLPKLVAKVEAANDLVQHFLGTISTPEKFEAQRLRMARIVWTRMQATDSRECRGCHSWEAMDFHKQRPESLEQMQKGLKENDTCISCHKGISHHMPDMSQGIQKMLDELMAEAKSQGAAADVLTSIATKPMFLERPAAEAGATVDARLLALSQVKVLQREGEWLKVRIEGWQQEGAERALYAMRGQRILNAALGAEAVTKVEQSSPETDPDTEIVWRRAAVTMWITREAMIGSRAPVLAYGAELFGDSCGTCHSPPTADSQLANQWIGSLNAMKQNLSLDDEQYRFLQKYLQLNARDTAGKN